MGKRLEKRPQPMLVQIGHRHNADVDTDKYRDADIYMEKEMDKDVEADKKSNIDPNSHKDIDIDMLDLWARSSICLLQLTSTPVIGNSSSLASLCSFVMDNQLLLLSGELRRCKLLIAFQICSTQ